MKSLAFSILLGLLPAIGAAQSRLDSERCEMVNADVSEHSAWKNVLPDRFFLSGDAFGLNPQYGATPLLDAAVEAYGDPDSAFEAITLAASCGSGPGLFVLGTFHDMASRQVDDGPEKLAEERDAFRFQLAAANSGYAWAEANVCSRLSLGRGVSRNYASAFAWCESAASKGMVHAQQELAVMYWNGVGVEQDRLQAYYWYSIALPGLDDFLRKPADDRIREVEATMTRTEIDAWQEHISAFEPGAL